MKDRTIVLTGAGLTAGPDFFQISTLGITQDFIAYNHPDLTDDKGFINFLYEEFCFWNKLDSSKVTENLGQINFETIIQIVEELFVFIEDIERSRRNSKFQRSVKNTVFDLNHRLITHVNRVRIPKWKDFIYLFVEKVHNHLIDLIITTVQPHDINKNNKGMIEFANFLDTSIDTTHIKRIYTLNYDSWLNRFANYFDGFTNKVLDRKKILFDRDNNCHYNLHGCILWQYFNDPEKLDSPREWKNIQSFAGYTIAREAILPSPIITGYNKLTRINLSPFLEIFNSFTLDCSSANRVLIIGYGFSDPHVNNILRLIPKGTKVVVVVYYNLNSLKDFKSDFHTFKFELEQVFGVHFKDLKTRSGLNYTLDSDDSSVSIFMNGIGQSFYDEYSKI